MNDLYEGASWYARAADEILAAKEADPTLTDKEIAERIGKSEESVRLLLEHRSKQDGSVRSLMEVRL